MANQQLLAYIKEHQAQFSKEQLVQALASAGWQAPDISDAFRELEQPIVPTQAPVMPPPVSTPAASVQPIAINIQPQMANIVPTTPTGAAPADSNAAFLAQMEKRRQEAAVQIAPQNPYQNITVGQKPAYQQFRSDTSATQEKGIIGLLMKMGAKNKQQANIIMIGVVAICLGLSAWLIWPSSPASNTKPPLPAHPSSAGPNK